jgi:hypothetical protein
MQSRRREDGIPRLVINVDHRVVGIFSLCVLVNPLSATPVFFPSSLARAALFGLVVYKPRGRRVAKPKICRKALVSGNAPSSPFSARTCQQWQVPFGLGSFWRDALSSREQPTGCMAWQAANGLTKCMCMCDCKMWWNCGRRWDNITKLFF